MKEDMNFNSNMQNVFNKIVLTNEQKEECLYHIMNRKSAKKKKIFRLPKVVATIVVLLVISLIVSFYYRSKKTSIIFVNNISNLISTKSKLAIPDESFAHNYTWKQLCDYFEKDVSLKYLPEGITDANLSRTFRIYADNKTILWDTISIDYYGNNNKAIELNVAKNKFPVMDEMFIGGKKSIINNVECMIYKNDILFNTTFIHDHIGYNITATNITQNEFIKILEDIMDN